MWPQYAAEAKGDDLKIHYFIYAAIIGLSGIATCPANAQDGASEKNIRAYWVCSILLPNSITPPTAVLHIAQVFEADTSEAAYDAQAERYGAELLDYAKQTGLQLTSEDPQLSANKAAPFCQGMTVLSDTYAKYDLLTGYSEPGLQMKVNKIAWIPAGTKAASRP